VRILLPVLMAYIAGAEIIDRIAVSVGNRVITAADLDREIRVTAFLQGQKLDFSPELKRATAERMVEQKLIQRELETARYPIPSADSIAPAIDEFKKKTFPSDQDYQRSLAQFGITDADVREAVLWQRTLLTFLGVRFEPGVQVSAQEIQDYFDKVVAPLAREANPQQAVALEDYSEQIREKLSGERANQEMTKWLDEAAKRTEIIYHDEVLR
jgi:hypothetical protein